MERKEETAAKFHALVLIFPLQGHINPMLQFSKRLAARGIKVTVVTTNSINLPVESRSNLIKFESIPEISNQEGEKDEKQTDNDRIDVFLKKIEAEVLEHLPMIFERKAAAGEPVKVLVYDSVMPYAFDIAQKQGILGAAFFTQSCTVCAIYHHIHQGTLKVPLEEPNSSLPSVPIILESKDLPSFIYETGSYPALLRLVLYQNLNFKKADWLFFNSFDSLEHEAISWMASQYPMIKAIGPTVPSMYLDKQLQDDKAYGLSLFKPDTEACLKWLDSKAVGSVVYASFGSLANLGEEQMEEIARGLTNSQCYFLWVVRASEESKLPSNFKSEGEEKGLIVNWCPQLEVLAHQSVGCFLTHCGWNSTLEALSLGVPMVAMPQWTDQPTNAKCIVDLWKTGVQVKACEGVMRKEEIKMAIKEVMVGEKSVELKKNATWWKELAKKAMIEGGSSDKNIEQFVSSFLST
ncbi:hypothetical protein ACH5RR_032302 [Cinchona calisaya]|uniref:Glycosyltransferase n=1 Tax=Cinchona calisaya TaxID=153742 RepID=A0ABD2YLX8_9GENT